MYSGAETAQLVEHSTVKPGAMLMQVRVPGVARNFCPGQLPAQTLTVSIQPPHAIAFINTCTQVKIPKHWQPYHWTHENIVHTLIGMGSAALSAAVPYPGKVT